MQLKQQLSNLFHTDEDGFIICTGINYKSIIKQTPKYQQSLQIFYKIVNGLGQLSATSQGLKQVITNIIKFSGTNQRIYIKTHGSQAVGFVKTGQKNLFYHNFIGQVKQLKPICVLDIYVHQSCQRSGYGKQIFQKFLNKQNTIPQKLAYDRPSPKLISFLRKHYQLTQFVPQNNNYVIFNKYFTTQNKLKPIQNQNYTIIRQNTQIKKQKQNQQQQQQKPITPQIQPIITNQIKSNRIVDSLQILKQQVQKSKINNNYVPISTINTDKQIKFQNNHGSFKNLDSYHIRNNVQRQSNGRYSLNMKIKDLSYRVPWATQGTAQTPQLSPQLQQNIVNINFRTTSNTYGNHYRH